MRTQNKLLWWPKCKNLLPCFGNANNDIYIAKSVSEFINIQLLFRVDSSNTGWRSEYDYLIIWSIKIVIEWVLMEIDFQFDSYFSHQRCLQATQAYRLCWLKSVS